MKDIDFDELDKAVSSVLSQVPSAKAVSTTKSDNTNSSGLGTPSEPQNTATTPAQEAPESNNITVQVKKAAIEDSQAAASAPLTEETKADTDIVDQAVVSSAESAEKPAIIISTSRKSGRFMDVVHPSSDMSSKDSNFPKRVSMAGRTMQPLGETIEPDTDTKPMDEIDSMAENQSDSNASEDERWPDPIEVASRTDGSLSPETASAEFPASTPPAFLNDAKVEKRPLGAFSDSPVSNDNQNTVTSDPINVESSAVQSQTIAGDKLPPELEGDIISVESDTHESDSRSNKPASVGSQAMPASATIAGTLSIPKQYQETERPSNDDAHSLFDTKDYHPPLNVHADHSHSFLWLWVLVASLLILGTAGLFAFWYMQGM